MLSTSCRRHEQHLKKLSDKTIPECIGSEANAHESKSLFVQNEIESKTFMNLSVINEKRNSKLSDKKSNNNILNQMQVYMTLGPVHKKYIDKDKRKQDASRIAYYLKGKNYSMYGNMNSQESMLNDDISYLKSNSK